MSIEVRKFGKAVNLAWSGSAQRDAAVLVMDSRKNWRLRRRLLKDKSLLYFDLLIDDEKAFTTQDVAEALNIIAAFNLPSLAIIACNEIAISFLDFALELLPDGLLLANPKPSRSTRDFQDTPTGRLQLLKEIPLIKVIHERNDEFSKCLLQKIENLNPETKNLKVNTFSNNLIELIRSPGYIQSFISTLPKSINEFKAS
ncbi:hypothetical protein [Salipiger abyssi]|uniref:hypothetical protein n=1 Tax=Salipiger abyssi TaxID=1250539 RepID=UPI00405A4AE9